MDYKDLMIGDWVICNHYQDKPFIKQFGVADFAKGEYEFCDPIPLTEEILVKNGFEKIAESQTNFDYTDNDIHLEYWIGDGFLGIIRLKFNMSTNCNICCGCVELKRRLNYDARC